jgi:hypothetical protein
MTSMILAWARQLIRVSGAHAAAAQVVCRRMGQTVVKPLPYHYSSCAVAVATSEQLGDPMVKLLLQHL